MPPIASAGNMKPRVRDQPRREVAKTSALRSEHNSENVPIVQPQTGGLIPRHSGESASVPPGYPKGSQANVVVPSVPWRADQIPREKPFHSRQSVIIGRKSCDCGPTVPCAAPRPRRASSVIRSSVPLRVHQASWSEKELNAVIAAAQRSDDDFDSPWIEYFPGNTSLVIAAPHDGTCRPNQLPRRVRGVMVRDTGTKGLAATIALAAFRLGKSTRPHLLICHIGRSRLDVNRARADAASHPEALQAWDCYHQTLSRAQEAAVSVAPGRALFIDIHAQANFKYTTFDAIELGTLCPSAQELQRGASYLDELVQGRLAALGSQDNDEQGVVSKLLGSFSMPRLAAVVLLEGGSFSELLCGALSMGSMLAKRGYQAIPSPDFPEVPPTMPSYTSSANEPTVSVESSAPFGIRPARTGGIGADDEPCESFGDVLHYFCGSASFTLRSSHLLLDSLQFECPIRLTKEPMVWEALAHAIVDSLDEFWRTHLHQPLLCVQESSSSNARHVRARTPRNERN